MIAGDDAYVRAWLNAHEFTIGPPGSAEPHATLRPGDLFGSTATYEAAEEGDLRVLDWLVTHGDAGDVGKHNANGNTPLFAACHAGHFDAAKWLIANGARSTVRSCVGRGKSGIFEVQPLRLRTSPRSRLRTGSV